MNILKVHHRSRKRILITNVLSMIVIGPFVFGLASLWNFQGLAMWISCLVFVANILFFGMNTWSVAKQRRDFVCLLADDRFVCQSPDESMAGSFDLALSDIAKLCEKEQMEGANRYSIHTQTGEVVTLSSNFGNPAWSFFEELRRLLPAVPFEKT